MRDEDGSIVPITMHFRQYREAVLNASDDTYVLDGRIETSNILLIQGKQSLCSCSLSSL